MSSPNEELCYTSAVTLVNMIKSKEISPVELTDAFLERIDAVNPKLNAYVTLLHEQARAQAKEAEAMIQRGDDLGPLHGLPVSIKDLAWTEGVRTTMGSKVYENFVPDEDAPVAARMLDAGAINLGKTNTPEFGWLAITENDLFGPTHNPWKLGYTSSGSSGGAAAAAAAGLSPIAHGSDGGGSIRHPASFCGIFGIKATYGMIPKHPKADGWPTLSHNGPLTRSVADGALALDVMTGYEPRDMYSCPLPPQEFLANLKADIKGLKIAWSRDLGHAEVDPEVVEHFEAGIKAFEEMGCELTEAHPDLSEARELFKMIMFTEAVGSDYGYIEEDGTSKMTADLTKFINNRKDILGRDYLGAQLRRQQLFAEVNDFFQDFDLFLTPTMAIPAFENPKTMADYPHEVNGVEVTATGWHPFTFPFNLTGQPAATVPCGFTKAGLPVGLQIIGHKYEDLLVMQAAAQFEEARPWTDKTPPII
jgi:aspartyl-tRNA(Asn)/glutamyl-tRNA(Gln) amidotransferase subunit A